MQRLLPISPGKVTETQRHSWHAHRASQKNDTVPFPPLETLIVLAAYFSSLASFTVSLSCNHFSQQGPRHECSYDPTRRFCFHTRKQHGHSNLRYLGLTGHLYYCCVGVKSSTCD